ncbi:MAG: hypothetical protein LDL33_15670 [Desulfomonile sp.]|nr:hypothetical protein [Desulfomonile sp.]
MFDYMAYLIVFPDHDSFSRVRTFADERRPAVEPVFPPEFCSDLVAPCLRVTGGITGMVEELLANGFSVSGTIEQSPLPETRAHDSPPLDPLWRDVLGGLRLAAVRPSLTDHRRLRLELVPGNDLSQLIPVMARFIRGGAFVPEIPSLAFEEDFRLLVVMPREIVISRADHLLDAWIMIRTMVDLICSVWERRDSLLPETKQRRGISAIEIYRRLPCTECRRCGATGCMEFARALITSRAKLEQCLPLMEGQYPSCLTSVQWLMRVLGLGKLG